MTLTRGRVGEPVTATSPRSLVPCMWCGMLFEGGPVCDLCGSPVIDTTGWTTVLDVSWPIDEMPEPSKPAPSSLRWLTVPEASALSGVPASAILSALEDGAPPAEGGAAPTFLLARRGRVVGLVPKEPGSAPVEAPPGSAESTPPPVPLKDGWVVNPTNLERRLDQLKTLGIRAAFVAGMASAAWGLNFLIEHAFR